MMRRSPAAQPEPFIRPSQTPDPAHQTRTLMHRPSGRQAPAAKAESSAAIRSMKWYAGRTVPPNPQPPLQGKQSSPDERSESMPAEAAANETALYTSAQTQSPKNSCSPIFSYKQTLLLSPWNGCRMLTHTPFVYSKKQSPRLPRRGFLLRGSPRGRFPPGTVSEVHPTIVCARRDSRFTFFLLPLQFTAFCAIIDASVSKGETVWTRSKRSFR